MSELYKLPEGWEWKSLNEVCTKITDGAHKSPKTIENGYPYITVKDVDSNGRIDFDNCKLISEKDFELLTKGNCMPFNGDVLFSKDGTVGKVALVNYETPFVILSSLAILRPSECILSEYLQNFLQSPLFMEKAIKSKTGAAIKRVVLRTIKEFKIPLPPLQEQKRIVAKLDSLFAKIDHAIALHQQNIDEADAFMGSVLNEVFGELEERYEKKLLKDIVTKLGDGLHGTPKYDETGDYHFINGANLLNNKIFIKDNTKKINKSEYEKYKKDLTNKTILVSINGTIGNVALYNNEKCVLGKSACYFNLKENIDKFYIVYVIKNGDFQRYIRANATGSTINNVSLKTMREYPVILPPLKIQQKIVQYLDQLSHKTQALKKEQQEKMQSLKDLKASILDRAFRGEI